MANNWYTRFTSFVAGTSADAEDVEGESANILAAFDKFPKVVENLTHDALSFVVDDGAADAYAVTFDPVRTAYRDGDKVSFIATNNNTGASTLKFDSLATKALVGSYGTVLAADAIVDGNIIEARYDSANNRFLIISPTDTASAASFAAAAAVSEAAAAASAASFGLNNALANDNASQGKDLVMTSGDKITTNVINETTAASGVTIDSVLLKDNTVLAGTLTISAGSIVDSSGAIDFGNENLSTTGTLAAGATSITGALAVTGNLAQSISTAGGNNNLSLRNTNAGATASTNINLGTDLSTATATITTFSEAHANAGKLVIHTGANRDLVLGTNGADRVTIGGSTGGVTLSSTLDVSGVTKGGGAYSGDIPTTSGFNAGGTNVVGQNQFTAVGGAGGYGAGFGASSYAGAAQVSMGKIVWDGIAAWNGTAANQDSKARIFTTVNGAATLSATFTGADAVLAGALSVAGAIKADSSSSGDYVRMYGGSGTGKWDIYGNGANLRIGDNESAGLVQIDTALTVGAGTAITNGAENVAVIKGDATHASFVNTTSRFNAVRAASSGYLFLQAYSGNSTDLEFSLRGDGNAFADGSWAGGGADYAEWFEWADGNPDNEDRVGYSVTLDGNKIKLAADGDALIGVISGMPAVIGDSDIDQWKGKYQKDDFGRYLLEEYTQIEWVEILEPAIESVEAVEAVEYQAAIDATYDDDDGVLLTDAVPEVLAVEGVQGIVAKDAVTEDHSYQHDQIPEGLTAPDDAVVTSEDENGVKLERRKLSDNYVEAPYVSREDRPEWSTVGLMGKLRIRKGQPVATSWIKMREISASVDEWLVK